MSAFKISWDEDSERKYELGTDRGVLFVSDKEEDSGYGPAIPWNGLTSVEEAPSGADANDIWADNMKYATLRSAEQFGFTIEAYTYPVEFEECDGCATALDGMVSIGQQNRKKFAFSFRSDVGTAEDDTVNPDDNYKLHLIWGASASPSSRPYETINDSPDAMTMSWECSSTPTKFKDGINSDFKPVCHIVIDKQRFITNGTGTVVTAKATKFKELEEYIYGTPETTTGGTTTPAVDGKMPSPDQVIRILTNGKSGADTPINS